LYLVAGVADVVAEVMAVQLTDALLRLGLDVAADSLRVVHVVLLRAGAPVDSPTMRGIALRMNTRSG